MYMYVGVNICIYENIRITINAGTKQCAKPFSREQYVFFLDSINLFEMITLGKYSNKETVKRDRKYSVLE